MVKTFKKTSQVQSDFWEDIVNIRNCSLGYECRQEWRQLLETDDQCIKYCKECEKNVYFIQTDHQLMEAIRGNRCVAIKMPNKSEVMVGMKISIEGNYDKPTYLRKIK